MLTSVKMKRAFARQFKRLANGRPSADAMSLVGRSNLFDKDYYLESYPDVRVAGMDPLFHFMNHGYKENRDPGDRFSVEYYKAFNNLGAGGDVNALVHFLQHSKKQRLLVAPARLQQDGHGLQALAREARLKAIFSQSGLFDATDYLRRYPDVKNAGMDPLEHFIQFGDIERRDPSDHFSTRHYAVANGLDAGTGALEHFLTTGWATGAIHLPSDLGAVVLQGALEPRLDALRRSIVQDSGLFDETFYFRRNPDVAATTTDGLGHFLQHGWMEGRKPHPDFDRLRQDCATGLPPREGLIWLVHDLVVIARLNQLGGQAPQEAERRRDLALRTRLLESGLFDPHYYLLRNGDVAAAGVDPLAHFLSSGGVEGRDPSQAFSSKYYILANGLAGQNLNALVHYLDIGRAQGCVTAPAALSLSRWVTPAGSPWAAQFNASLSRRVAALESADLTPPLPGRGPTFSIITTVYDTDPEFVRKLARSVREQAFTDFEWVLLDNGSRTAASIEVCREIAALDDRIRYYRVEDNLHIIGGNRYAFDRAVGRYVVPVDSDDLLYQDTLALFADAIRNEAASPPVVLFSDEQKIDENDAPLELMWRWKFSLAHAMSTVPAAHLMAFDRGAGQVADVYSDNYALGSHDWDSMLRIAQFGGHVRHVPEVLYGWRVHAASTASSASAKDYIISSQTGVVEHALKRRSLENRFDIVTLFPGVPGWYWPKRRKIDMPDLAIDFVVDADAPGIGYLQHNIRILAPMKARQRVLYDKRHRDEIEALRKKLGKKFTDLQWVECSSRAGLAKALAVVGKTNFAKALVSARVGLRNADAMWDAIGVLEIDPKAGVVGGGIVRCDELIVGGGMLAGLDDLLGYPFAGWRKAEVPLHLWQVHRPVDAFPMLAVVIRGDLLRTGLTPTALDTVDGLEGAQFCLAAARLDYGAVYTPLMEVEVTADFHWSVGAGTTTRARLKAEPKPYLWQLRGSPYLARESTQFGQLAPMVEEGRGRGAAMTPHVPALPLNLALSDSLAYRPTINLLLPIIGMTSMSGGPNTALNVGMRLAREGFAVRLVSTDLPPDADQGPLWRHIDGLAPGGVRPDHIEIVDGSDRSRPLMIGANDIFLATAWWTAQMAEAAAPLVQKPFIYLIQDFEPILYPASSAYALALETYSFDHIAIVNTKLLLGYLIENRIGRFADKQHSTNAVVFDPAVDPDAFHYQARNTQPRTLLFYARPSFAARNLFDIGVAALKAAIARRSLSADSWRIVGMGEQFEPVDLGRGARLECAPWLGFESYAHQMRDADILLSLMLSPHPSYPPLEMAACGGLVVTNSYANKTNAAMAEISANIIAVEPTTAAIADAIEEALFRLEDIDARRANAKTSLPPTWDEAFEGPLGNLADRIRSLGLPDDAATWPPAAEPRFLKAPRAESNSPYALYLADAERRAAMTVGAAAEPCKISIVTIVWNVSPTYLAVLADSVRDQIGGLDGVEWFVLDNGSTRFDTREALRKLAKQPHVRFERSEENLGIVRGTRYCLKRATGRYYIPLDHDDYLHPGCIQTVRWWLAKTDYPAIMYTDEDKVLGETLFLPYQKPDWDPALFTTSCYTSHLCVIDRRKAIKLGAYSDPQTEGSQDWDLMTRFAVAGYRPVHVPEITYGWRIHSQSTAGDINSKPIVYQSQQAVIRRMLTAHDHPERFEVVRSPLFTDTPDWWVRRKREHPKSVTTVVLTDPSGDDKSAAGQPGVERVTSLSENSPVAALRAIVEDCVRRGDLVHVMASTAILPDDEWKWEATGLLELYPDAVGVTGRVRKGALIERAGGFVEAGAGVLTPDEGRLATEVGYQAQLWKTRATGAGGGIHDVYRPEFLLGAIATLEPFEPSLARLGEWLGIAARSAKRSLIYSPYVEAEIGDERAAPGDLDETARLRSASAELEIVGGIQPPRISLAQDTPYEPRVVGLPGFVEVGFSDPDSYAQWVSRDLDQRAALSSRDGEVGFSFLMTLYIGTDADLLRKTADSLLAQTHRDFEWLILTHGPVPPAVRNLVDRLASDDRVTVYSLDENLGIVGGMRYVLERATKDYIVPVDGDDLLSPDALALLARTIVSSKHPPAYVYSDEDIVTGASLQAPFRRPAWDPVLDLETSWIWHLGAFRRAEALEQGVYTDTGSEYCHDWDTVNRMSGVAGGPVHLPAVLYHWRHHEKSSSASGSTNEGTLKSVRSLLARKIEQKGLAKRYDVAPSPVWRGAQEFCISSRPRSRNPVPDTVQMRPDTGFWRDLTEALNGAEDGVLILLKAESLPAPSARNLAEAIKLFDFVDDVVAVGGRVEVDGAVVTAGMFTDDAGRPGMGYDGFAVNEAGAFALALKAQTVAAPTPDICYARAGFLKEALAACPDHCAPLEFGLWLGAWALKQKKRIAFSPAISLTATSREGLWTPDPVQTGLAWEVFVRTAKAPVSPRRGPAGYRKGRHR